MKEANDRSVDINDLANAVEVISKNVAMIYQLVDTINSVMLVLMSKGIDLPDWKTKEDVEPLTEEVEKCVKLIRGIYGPGEVDKS